MVLAEALRAGGNEDRSALELQAARTMLERIEVVAPATTEANIFRREGDYWSVVFEGRTVHVRDLKGMRYLAQLLTHPGREFHVLDLVAAETGQQTALGDAGEMLDERAKIAYRRRLAEIEDDIEQARALEDTEREAQADAERDFLVRELARAVGLGGRDRRAASASERARSGVTRAVRQGIARIGEHDPELGGHLNRAVRTGTYCVYVPDSGRSCGLEVVAPPCVQSRRKRAPRLSADGANGVIVLAAGMRRIAVRGDPLPHRVRDVLPHRLFVEHVMTVPPSASAVADCGELLGQAAAEGGTSARWRSARLRSGQSARLRSARHPPPPEQSTAQTEGAPGMPAGWSATRELAPQSIPFASIVGYLVALDRAPRRATASSAGIVGHRAS